MSVGRSEHVETSGNAVAVRCLSDAIDGSGITRADLADRVGVGEPQLSKLTRGAGIELIDSLPDAVLIPWLQKMGRERGFEVREVAPREIDDEILSVLGRLITLAKLRDVRTRQVKVSLPGSQLENRRRA